MDALDSDDAKEADSVSGDDEEDWAERSESEVDETNGVEVELSVSRQRRLSTAMMASPIPTMKSQRMTMKRPKMTRRVMRWI